MTACDPRSRPRHSAIIVHSASTALRNSDPRLASIAEFPFRCCNLVPSMNDEYGELVNSLRSPPKAFCQTMHDIWKDCAINRRIAELLSAVVSSTSTRKPQFEPIGLDPMQLLVATNLGP